ncbi:MAG: M28 family peptidase [Bdellovibrio sp.]
MFAGEEPLPPPPAGNVPSPRREIFQAPPAARGLISQARQISFIGPKAGEGYFSIDARKMVFQSEREPGNPFYQIYLADRISGEVQRVSTGLGKTTCAWIHPLQDRVLFSSTHEDPELKQKVQQELEHRRNPKSHRYAWSFDEAFALYERNLWNGGLKKLLGGLGYHAEASYSPDGRWVVLASNRHVYEQQARGELSTEDQKKLAEDPSFFMEIYLMRSDGSGLKRLTQTPGYDGGPFFSPAGDRITWRRFATDSKTAEIFTMDLAGSDVQQITRLSSMAWAPFYHPSGDYIVFTSNLLGFQNFELFVVRSDGQGDAPVQVTFQEGFDGLPVFLPNGREISWTRRNTQGESQIYLASWDDTKVREILGLSKRPPRKSQLKPEIRTEDLKDWLDYFADRSLGGRLTGSAQEKLWVESSAQFLRELGYEVEIQKFSFAQGVQTDPRSQLRLLEGSARDPTQMILGKDFQVSAYSSSAQVSSAPVVFAGFGIFAAASSTAPALDSYGDLDVKGKWVVILKDLPSAVSSELRAHWSQSARTQFKATVARQRGAVGVIFVGLPGAHSLASKEIGQSSGIPVLMISDSEFQAWVKKARKESQGLSRSLDQGRVEVFEFPFQLSGEVGVRTEMGEASNLIARTPGSKKRPHILVGAHGDHLGTGVSGTSLALQAEQGLVHPGADDNASGMAAVMELAHRFAPPRSGPPLVFALWSGEELGALGSTHYLQKNSQNPPIRVALNLDMLGRLQENLRLQGVGSSPVLRPLVEKLALRQSLPLSAAEDPFLPTDSLAFYNQGIPVLDFFTGSHSEYHSPRDDRSLIHWEGLRMSTELVEQSLRELFKLKSIPFQKVESSRKKLAGRAFRVFVGTIPDYQGNASAGVRIMGTSMNSPAEKAGLLKGDVLRRVQDISVQSLQDFSFALQSLVPGKEIEIEIERGGKILKLPLTPERRDE